MSASSNFLSACKIGNYNDIRELIDSGVDINAKDKDGFNGLHYACQNDNENIISLLIEAGIEINAKDKDGFNGLHHAVEHDYENIIPILIEAGIDINAKDNYGRKPFTVGIFFEYENESVKRLLVDAGCDLSEEELQTYIVQDALAANAQRREGAKNAMAEIDFPRRAAGCMFDSDFPQIRYSILNFIFLTPSES